jgi:hypothetical protein
MVPAPAFVLGQVVAAEDARISHLVDVATDSTVRALCGQQFMVRNLRPAAGGATPCRRCEATRSRRRISVVGGGVQ